MRGSLPFWTIGVALAGLCSCGRGDREEGSGEQVRIVAITDGQPYSGHPSVGYMVVPLELPPPDQDKAELCTVTLVGQRTVLTAAHCIIPGKTHQVFIGGVLFGTSSRLAHPDLNVSTLDNDIALIRLDRDPPVAPSMISRLPPSKGQEVTLIGFGTTAQDAQDAMVKRIATNTVHELFSNKFTIAGTGNGTGNTCHGDSGGPVFATLDGQEVQVGVTSGGDKPCGTKGYSTLVSAFLPWLTQNAGGDLTVGPVEGDREPPQVTITYPPAGGAVPEMISAGVTATDNVGVTMLELFLDGAQQASATKPPFLFSLTLAVGAHTLKAVARDQAGNQGKAQVSFTVDATLPPEVGTYGSTCIENANCQSGICGTDLSTQRRFCTDRCDPAQNNCKPGVPCLDTGSIYVCGPPQAALSGDILVGGCSSASTSLCPRDCWWVLLFLPVLSSRRRSTRGLP